MCWLSLQHAEGGALTGEAGLGAARVLEEGLEGGVYEHVIKISYVKSTIGSDG